MLVLLQLVDSQYEFKKIEAEKWNWRTTAIFRRNCLALSLPKRLYCWFLSIEMYCLILHFIEPKKCLCVGMYSK